MDMLPYQIGGLSQEELRQNFLERKNATPGEAVVANLTANGYEVKWRYTGTPYYFYVQIYRNGQFKGNTKVSTDKRSYTYTSLYPAGTKIQFVVYAIKGRTKLVGKSRVYEQPASAKAPAPVQKSYEERKKAEIMAKMARGEIAYKPAEAIQVKTPTQGSNSRIDSGIDLPGQGPTTAGSSGILGGNSNMLIYGGLAAAVAYFLFMDNKSNNNKSGLSGTKNKSSRKPAKRATTTKPRGSAKAKGRPAAKKSKRPGRMQVIDL